MANFDLNQYVQVNERIEAFYKKYPEGSIQSEIVLNTDGQVIFKAYVYRDREDTKPATGHAMEKEGSSYINKTSHIENCETSAVGRALAMLGFEIKKSVASREEVANAVHQQEQLSQPQKQPSNKQTAPTKVNTPKTNKNQTEGNTEVNKTKIDALKSGLASINVTEDYICKFYKLNSLDDIDYNKWLKAMEWVANKKAKVEGQ